MKLRPELPEWQLEATIPTVPSLRDLPPYWRRLDKLVGRPPDATTAADKIQTWNLRTTEGQVMSMASALRSVEVGVKIRRLESGEWIDVPVQALAGAKTWQPPKRDGKPIVHSGRAYVSAMAPSSRGKRARRAAK